MSEELEQAGAAGEPVSASGEAGAAQAAPDAGAVSETLEGLSPEIRTAIQAEVKAAQEAVRAEYEGDTGHISKLKSQRDRLKNRLAKVERDERQRARAQHEHTRTLMESDPERAANLALGQNEQLLAQQAQIDQREEVSDWVLEIMGNMGYDLDDDEALALAEAKTQKIVEGLPSGANYTYEVQQELARGLVASRDDTIAASEKKIKAMEDGLQAMVREEVTRAVAGGNSPDGGAPGTGATAETWRTKPSGQKRKDGLAKRRANPVRKVPAKQ
jgi:hypothetical protein